MCSPIALRMCVSGTISSPWPGVEGADGAAGVTLGAGCGAAPGEGTPDVGTAAGPAAMAASTSCLVMRPPVPVPAIADRSRSCSAASLRTSGDRICDRGPGPASRGPSLLRPPPGLAPRAERLQARGPARAADDRGDLGCGVFGGVFSGGCRGGRGCGRAVARVDLRELGADGDGLAFGARGSSSRCRRRARGPRCRPCRWRSRRAARRARSVSPSCFSHFRIVPSMIVSPSCGIWIEVTGASPPGSACRWSPGREPLDRGLDVGYLRQVGIFQRGREGHGRVRAERGAPPARRDVRTPSRRSWPPPRRPRPGTGGTRTAPARARSWRSTRARSPHPSGTIERRSTTSIEAPLAARLSAASSARYTMAP